MPLIKGKSPAAFEHNVKAEMHSGKPQKQSLAIAYNMKRKAQAKKMAEGGEVEEPSWAEQDHENDPVVDADSEYGIRQPVAPEPEYDGGLVDKVMRKHFSEGGVIANEGEDMLDHLDDGKPNEFDDLVLEGGDEFHYTGANSGDEIGDEQEDHDRHDIVSRIMRSEAKKDRLPKVR